ncbi:MAG TPA: hypothetical protein VH593_26545, partial [Ktedonobacteraceae bacterium]
MPDEFTFSDEELADLMAETVHCTLESDRSVSSSELQTVSRTFMEYLDRSLASLHEQFYQELES